MKRLVASRASKRRFLNWREISQILLSKKMNWILMVIVVFYLPIKVTGFEPGFVSPLENITAAAGRSAHFTCVVNNLGGHKVAWLRSDSKAILAIHTHMVTNNPRMTVEHNGHNSWTLMIDSVQRNDSGLYMCQINTEPMTSQIGMLNVVEAPDILYNETSNDTIVAEGASVQLKCEARGYPEPTVTWRREDGTPIVLRGLGMTSRVESVEGSELKLERLTRADMGAYLCIASNRIPSPVSKRIMVHVHFFPLVKVHDQIVATRVGTTVSLRCSVEAWPRSVNYWVQRGREKNDLDRAINPSRRFRPTEEAESLYTFTMTLTIIDVKESDFGNYSCQARNSLGTTMGTIELLKMKEPEIIDFDHKKSILTNDDLNNNNNNNEINTFNSNNKIFYEGGVPVKDESRKEEKLLTNGNVESPGAGVYYVSFGRTTESFNFGSGRESHISDDEDDLDGDSRKGVENPQPFDEQKSKMKKRQKSFSSGSTIHNFGTNFIELSLLLLIPIFVINRD